MEDDDRPAEIRKKFPLRQIRLDMCICGHDNSDHLTEVEFAKVKDGTCALCVCKGFELANNKNEGT